MIIIYRYQLIRKYKFLFSVILLLAIIYRKVLPKVAYFSNIYYHMKLQDPIPPQKPLGRHVSLMTLMTSVYYRESTWLLCQFPYIVLASYKIYACPSKMSVTVQEYSWIESRERLLNSFCCFNTFCKENGVYCIFITM